MKTRSLWGGCKRALYGAPEIWESVRETAMQILKLDDVDSQEKAEFLLASVMCYAAYGVQLNCNDKETMRLVSEFWKEIDQAAFEVKSDLSQTCEME